MRLSTMGFAAAMLSAAWLCVPPANAQNQSASPAVSDTKLDAAAAAMERVGNLQKTYQQQLATAAPADKERIADEGNKALEKAVTDQGLSVDEYTSILDLAQNDPAVRDKLIQRLQRPAK
jgi:predicted ATPase with chaperone activity